MSSVSPQAKAGNGTPKVTKRPKALRKEACPLCLKTLLGAQALLECISCKKNDPWKLLCLRKSDSVKFKKAPFLCIICSDPKNLEKQFAITTVPRRRPRNITSPGPALVLQDPAPMQQSAATQQKQRRQQQRKQQHPFHKSEYRFFGQVEKSNKEIIEKLEICEVLPRHKF